MAHAGPVNHILASRPNVYTGSPLDRVSSRRDDEAWVTGAMARPDTLVAPVWRARSLLAGVEAGQPAALYLNGQAARGLLDENPWALLGLRGETAVFALDLSAEEEPLARIAAASAGEAQGAFTDLRATAGLLAADDASVLAHARGLMHWRARHRFCGVCGQRCAPKAAGNVVACTACGTQHFPRTDPAVIMLITDGDRALLGHSKRFPNSTMYSTLAGFVEPGESLEEAVRREVFEEAGIRVGKVLYHSSQPWPFPASIMLGFYGEALSEEITVDTDELVDARWFPRDQMRDPAAHGFQLPRGDSIARRLIEDWIATS